ncbi:hypothetical protein ACH3XW_4375 [Acanthocheilonema viteae]
MIITLFIFFITFAILGLLAIWLLCAYYRRKSRKQVEKELQRRRDDENQLKLDMFRKKQLDLQMLTAMRSARIGPKDLLCSQEALNPRMSYVPYIQSPNSEQYPKLLNSTLYEKSSPFQSVPSTIPNAGKNKISKETENLQFLRTATAKTPSQKTKKDGKVLTEKDSQKTNRVKVKNDEKPQIQQYETDISVSNNNRSAKRKRKKKRKSKTKPERYQHQIPPDNVHEWIYRIARSAKSIPYFSPNKRVLLIPELSTEDSGDRNDEENGRNNDATGTNTSEQSTNFPSYTNEGEVETDVEMSTETKEQSTPMTPTFPTSISASINAPPSDTFLNDQLYWRKENKQKKYLKIGNDSKINCAENTIERPKEKVLWNPPDKRAEARLNRTLENPW